MQGGSGLWSRASAENPLNSLNGRFVKDSLSSWLGRRFHEGSFSSLAHNFFEDSLPLMNHCFREDALLLLKCRFCQVRCNERTNFSILLAKNMHAW